MMMIEIATASMALISVAIAFLLLVRANRTLKFAEAAALRAASACAAFEETAIGRR